jgi:hypothetical protein
LLFGKFHGGETALFALKSVLLVMQIRPSTSDFNET